jgi:hypothetical protein
MKSVLGCFLLVTAGLCAQSTNKLNSDLMSLTNPGASRNAVAQQVTNDILALAEKDAQPSRQSISDFANELTKALGGKQLTVETIKPVTAAILDVLQSSGSTSSRFHAAVERFRVSMFPFGASPPQVKNAVDRLFVLGQEIHGPEDLPVNLPRRTK